MRSKIEANEYKDYILSFIFYKFLSEKEIKFLKSEHLKDKDLETELSEENKENHEYIQKKLVYFISYENLFSTWISKGTSFGIGNLNAASSLKT